jgi:hypothetical protein
MGFSGGPDYKDLDGNEFHLEAKDRGIAIWSKDEMHRFLMLSKEDAIALANDLLFHAGLIV